MVIIGSIFKISIGFCNQFQYSHEIARKNDKVVYGIRSYVLFGLDISNISASGWVVLIPLSNRML